MGLGGGIIALDGLRGTEEAFGLMVWHVSTSRFCLLKSNYLSYSMIECSSFSIEFSSFCDSLDMIESTSSFMIESFECSSLSDSC